MFVLWLCGFLFGCAAGIILADMLNHDDGEKEVKE